MNERDQTFLDDYFEGRLNNEQATSINF